MNKINWAFAAAITVSLCWLIGDIFIVGFNPNPADYPLFSKEYADKVDVELAIHMLEGSTQQLMFGALIGGLSAPLLLPAMWLVKQVFIDKKNWFTQVTYYILLAGAILSPLAHASFFYIGEIYKAILNTDKSAHTQLLETAKGFEKMLAISWGSAIGILGVGWFMLIIFIAFKKTVLPRWTVLITPIPITILLVPFKNILQDPYFGWVQGAAFNIAYLIFFVMLFVLYRKRIWQNAIK